MGKKLMEDLKDKGPKDFGEFLTELDLNKRQVDEYVDKTQKELVSYMLAYQTHLDNVRIVVEELKNYQTELGDIRQAKIVLEHWRQFNKFLDENPDYKQEWDTLCMAMRLQES